MLCGSAVSLVLVLGRGACGRVCVGRVCGVRVWMQEIAGDTRHPGPELRGVAADLLQPLTL